MRKRINTVIRHPLISGSAVIFFGSLFANVFNFLFNLFMSRNLTVENYGVLASLISLITLATLPATAVVPTVVHFAASYFAKQEIRKIRGLFFKVTKVTLVFGLVYLGGFFIFSRLIGDFFNIRESLFIQIAGLTVFFGLLNSVNGSILQAKLNFGFISFANIFSALVKFILGAVLIFSGFGVSGAMWAFFVSFSGPYILSFIPLSFLFEKTDQQDVALGSRELFSYAAPAAVALFSLTSFISTDVILVKHFLNANLAGLYAGLSLIGRVIFFFSAPIGTVMFPLIVQKHSKKENYHTTLFIALLLVATCSLILALVYYLFPELVIRLFLKRDEYLSIAQYLWIFGIFIGLYSVVTVLTNFFLSIRYTVVSIPIFVMAVFQAIGISLYHNSFFHIIFISFASMSLLLIVLIVYYIRLFLNEKEYFSK